jgi:hypothetical protein
MLSKLKNIRGGAGFVLGLIVAVLLIPSVAIAATATLTEIKGASGNKANVTAAGQLQTSPADINSAFATNIFGFDAGDGSVPIYAPPTGDAAVITSIHVDVSDLTGSADDYVVLDVCNQGIFLDEVDTTTDGAWVLPYSPGYVIPAGESLCAATAAGFARVEANGYLVPAADAPSAPQTPAASSARETPPTEQ